MKENIEGIYFRQQKKILNLNIHIILSALICSIEKKFKKNYLKKKIQLTFLFMHFKNRAQIGIMILREPTDVFCK